MEHPTFIATVKLDADSSRALNLLRKRYFPPERDFLDAHITLFHNIHEEGLAILDGAVADADPRRFEVALDRPYPLGRGVAIRVESGRLVALRNRLAGRLHADLTAQDRQPYAPHVTIQNKVTAEEANGCLIEMRRQWLPSLARVEGISVWEYLGGPWRHHATLPFRE